MAFAHPPDLILNGDMALSAVHGTTPIAEVATGSLVTFNVVDEWTGERRGTYTIVHQQVTDAPAGFSRSAKFTVTVAQGSIGANDRLSLYQSWSGAVFQRLGFGTASARWLVLTFWVKAVQTGTPFSGVLRVGTSGNMRALPFVYSVAATNTWERKTIMIPGDIAGAALWNSGSTASLVFNLAAGANLQGTPWVWGTPTDIAGATSTKNLVSATNDVFQLAGVSFVPGPVGAPRPTWLIRFESARGFFDPEFFDPDFFAHEPAILYAAIRDIDTLDRPYEGLIAISPEISRSYTDPIRRIVATERLSYVLSDTPAALKLLYDGDPRGLFNEILHYDQADGFLMTRFLGQTSGLGWSGGRLEVHATNVDFAALDDEVPKLTVDTTLFPGAVDVGGVVPILFGSATNVWLPCILDDKPGSRFHYLAPLASGGGAITVNALRRDGVGFEFFQNMDVSEYTVSTSLYPGFTAISFPRRQEREGGERYRIYGDFTCVDPMDRNPVRARRNVLENATWGLGQSIDGASFDAAEADIVAIGGLFVDGVLTQRRTAIEVLKHLGVFRGQTLGMNASGQWTESVDKKQAPATWLTLRDGPGDGERTAERFGTRERRTTDDMIKRLVVRYRRHGITGEYQETVTRSVMWRGRDEIVELELVADGGSADRIADYLAKRIKWGDNTLSATGVQDLRAIDVGHVIPVEYERLGVDGVYEVLSIRDRLTHRDLVLQGGDQAEYDAIFVYEAGAIPIPAQGPVNVDYSKTLPNPATFFSIIAHGPAMAEDGHTVGWATLQWTAPLTNCGFTIIFYADQTVAPAAVMQTAPVYGTGVLNTTIENMVSGHLYAFRAVVYNHNGTLPATTQPVVLHVADGDLTAPGIPTGLAVADQKQTTITFGWTNPPDDDLGEIEYEIRTGSSSADGTGTGSIVTARSAGAKASTLTLNVSTIGYGATRHLRIRAKDISHNPATADGPGAKWSATVSFSFSRIVGGDVGDGEISPPKIPPGVITTTERQNLTVDTDSVSHVHTASGIKFTNHVFTHGFGKKVTVIPSLTGIGGESQGGGNVFVSWCVSASDTGGFTVRVTSVAGGAVTLTATLVVEYW